VVHAPFVVGTVRCKGSCRIGVVAVSGDVISFEPTACVDHARVPFGGGLVSRSGPCWHRHRCMFD
jgi:hypothetical protein